MKCRTLQRRTLLVASLAGFAATYYPQPVVTLAAPASPAEKLVHDAANRFLHVMRNGARRDEVAEALNRYVALGSLALFVLGKHRKHLKPDQEQRYIGLFENMVLNAIDKYGRKIEGDSFVVENSHRSIVRGYIKSDSDRLMELEFRTRENRITDVRVAGFWMSILLRHSFDHVISQGGDIDAIFAYLKSGKLPL